MVENIGGELWWRARYRDASRDASVHADTSAVWPVKQDVVLRTGNSVLVGVQGGGLHLQYCICYIYIYAVDIKRLIGFTHSYMRKSNVLYLWKYYTAC